jgi:hypothetical protein
MLFEEKSGTPDGSLGEALSAASAVPASRQPIIDNAAV